MVLGILLNVWQECSFCFNFLVKIKFFMSLNTDQNFLPRYLNPIIESHFTPLKIEEIFVTVFVNIIASSFMILKLTTSEQRKVMITMGIKTPFCFNFIGFVLKCYWCDHFPEASITVKMKITSLIRQTCVLPGFLIIATSCYFVKNFSGQLFSF